MSELREILFRGKVSATGEWRIGCFCMGYSSRAVPTPFIGSLNHRGTVVFAAVDPETVGQFTGAVDREGHRVFEGDVLSIDFDDGDTELLLIRYENMQFIGVALGCPEGVDDELFISEEILSTYYKVVGNIHDVPELLGGC